MRAINKAWQFYKKNGLRLFLRKLFRKYQMPGISYQEWRAAHLITGAERKKQENDSFSNPVLISIIVPVYRTPEKFLREMLESVQAQTYHKWELCIADGSEDDLDEKIIQRYQEKDARIKYRHLEQNLGISDNTNAALQMAEGDYIALLDHDDTLEMNALYEVAKGIEENPEAGLIYTDEDKVSIDLKEYFEPHFKPSFNKELLKWNNYICHFLAVRRDIVKKAGEIRKEYEGAQDYDFILRCCEAADCILHIPKILYHWRTHGDSTAVNPESKSFAYEAGKRAIEAHLERIGEKAQVEYGIDAGFYNIIYNVQEYERVNIFVSYNKQSNNQKILEKCLQSIREKNHYPSYHIHVVESYDKITWDGIKGRYVILIDGMLKVLTSEWIEKMLGSCQRKDIGAVGGKIYMHDDRILHAGIVLGMEGYAFQGFPSEKKGYFHRESLGQELGAVSWRFMIAESGLIKQSVKKFGGFPKDEREFCKQLSGYGRKIIYNPIAEAKEMYKTSRKQIYCPPDLKIRKQEQDPYYNPNLAKKSPGYFLQK